MWRRLLFLIRRGEYTRDLNDEISQHLESKAQRPALRTADGATRRGGDAAKGREGNVAQVAVFDPAW
jgi:hypothetical protein